MNIREAITAARKVGDWCIVQGEPTSVAVGFLITAGDTSNRLDGEEDETELDLYSDDPEQELDELWSSLAEEMQSDRLHITSVYAYGYIREN